MVTSIVLTGMHKIGISSAGKIKTPDGVLVELKNIPFVRYRFSQYGEEEFTFILENKKNFSCVHLVELKLDKDTLSTIDRLNELDDMIGKIVYVDITDEDVTNGINDETIVLLEELQGADIDRLSLRDKSTTLFPLALSIMKKQVKQASGIKEDQIGVCGGPCCFSDGNACLTAVKAREILARYSEEADVVVPSSNHEGSLDNTDNIELCTNKCGCIRYHIFNKSMDAPASKADTKKVTVEVIGADGTVSAEVKEKKPKVVKNKGYTAVEW